MIENLLSSIYPWSMSIRFRTTTQYLLRLFLAQKSAGPWVVLDNCPTDQQINNKNVTIYDVGRGKIEKFRIIRN